MRLTPPRANALRRPPTNTLGLRRSMSNSVYPQVPPRGIAQDGARHGDFGGCAKPHNIHIKHITQCTQKRDSYINYQPLVRRFTEGREAYCLSVKSRNACLSRSFCTSSPVQPRFAFSFSRCVFFLTLNRRLIQRKRNEMNSYTVRRTMIEIFPGMYAGASLGWKISVPMTLPKLNITKVIALIVFCGSAL